MASAKAQSKTRRWPVVAFIFVAAVAVVVGLSVSFTGQAQGAGEADTSTVGLGSSQFSSEEPQLDVRARFDGGKQAVSTVPSEAASTTDTAQRTITVKDPDPVVVPVAIDRSNPAAVEAAGRVATLDPLPTAPRVAPDLKDGTWASGVASGYNVTTNDDGKGNFGVTTTASGVALSDSSVTVAVPESQAYLLGSIVEICYDGKVVVATVTDTGGFAKYGRVLDLAPGVYHALGASSPSEWGTRTVSYRFI